MSVVIRGTRDDVASEEMYGQMPDRSASDPALCTMLFSVEDKVGALEEVLRIVRSRDISLSRIESRPSRKSANEYELFVDLRAPSKAVSELVELLKPAVKSIQILGTGQPGPCTSNIRVVQTLN